MLLKLKYCHRYVNNTFIVWSHGEKLLLRFLDHMNSVHPWNHCITEKKAEEKLAFLDMLILRSILTDICVRTVNHHQKHKHAVANQVLSICEP